jgi:RND family efflux transporter MFP subunit
MMEQTSGVRWLVRWTATPLVVGALVMASRATIASDRGVLDASYSCVSRPSEIRELGFATRGIVGEVRVKPGDRVGAGDMLATLNTDVQRQQLAVAKIQAEDDTTIRQAETTVEYRKIEVEMLRKARAQDGGTDAQMREAVYRAAGAEIELANARVRQQLNQTVLRREEAQLREMEIRSPIAGTVLDVLKRAGEIVDETKAVVTLVSVNPLRVDVDVPTRDAAQILVGQEAEVVWEDIDDKTPMRGKVTYKAPAGDLGARRIQLRVEVANPKEIPSGMHGKLRFLAKDEGAKGEATAPNKSPTVDGEKAPGAGPWKK